MELSEAVTKTYEKLKTDSLFVRYNACLLIGEAASIYIRGKSSGVISNYLNEQNLSNLIDNFSIAATSGIVAGITYQAVRGVSSLILEKERRLQNNLSVLNEFGNFFGKSNITSFNLNIAATIANVGLLSYLSPQNSGYITQIGLVVAYLYMMNVNRDKTIVDATKNNFEMITNSAKKASEYIKYSKSNIIE